MPFDLNPPTLQFPLIGNSIAVGIPSLLHIVVAGLSVAFLVLAPIFEWRGRRSAHFTDLAHAVTKFTVLIFSVSTVLAVIMVELLIGLFPVTTMWMWNQFRGPIALALAAFLLQFAFLYPYYHFWEPVRRRSVVLHILLGSTAALLMLIWVAVLDGMGSYMLTPVDGATTWANIWNPTWVPLALHRLFGELVMAGYVIAAYGAWRLGRDAQDHREYYTLLTKVGWLCGAGALLIQPLTGVLYAWSIRQSVPEAYEQVMRGEYQLLAYAQFTLIGLLMAGNHWLLKRAAPLRQSAHWLDWAIPTVTLLMIASVGHTALRRTLLFLLAALTLWSIQAWFRGTQPTFEASFTRWTRPIAFTLAVLSILTYVTMGTIRETARRPDTVRHLISLDDEAAQPAADRKQHENRRSAAANPERRE
jgi:cytochrome bd ubiquinol oxidase subunit I